MSPAPTAGSITIVSTPMPIERGRLLALDAEITIDGGAYSNWPFTVALEPGQATGNLPGPYDFRGYRCRTYCVATNKPGFLPYRGVARTGVCFAIELMIDAIAREVGREPWEVRLENLVHAGGDALRQCHAQALRQRRLSEEPGDRARERSTWTNGERARSRVKRTGDASASASPVIASNPRTAPACLPPGGCRSFPATTRPPYGCCRMAAWRCGSVSTPMVREWRRRWRRSLTRCSASISRRSA